MFSGCKALGQYGKELIREKQLKIWNKVKRASIKVQRHNYVTNW
jgi:hypothetical protein